jgi:hypothetical protein
MMVEGFAPQPDEPTPRRSPRNSKILMRRVEEELGNDRMVRGFGQLGT